VIATALSAGVIPAKAGTHDTLQHGLARGEETRVQHCLYARPVPAYLGDVGARLRGHDVVVSDAPKSDRILGNGDVGRGRDYKDA
jgi:hypothetical protein